MTRISSIGIDVDSLRCYREIHGLPRSADDSIESDPIYTIALDRFAELLDTTNTRATLFLIGRDAPHHARRLAFVHARGCEVASHSHAHDYRLSKRLASDIADDLARAEAALVPLNGGLPLVGFRAPGYNVSRTLLRALVARGYRYDSSLLPSPPYWLARGATLALYRALGRPSRSHAGSPRAFLGSCEPRRADLDAPWRACVTSTLVEIPIACEPTTRIPLIGTAWAAWPRALRTRLVARALERLACFNFEMHAIDLLDATDSGIPSDLANAQPDLRIPAAQKMRAFRELFDHLARHTDVRTLAEIATTAGALGEGFA